MTMTMVIEYVNDYAYYDGVGYSDGYFHEYDHDHDRTAADDDDDNVKDHEHGHDRDFDYEYDVLGGD